MASGSFRAAGSGPSTRSWRLLLPMNTLPVGHRRPAAKTRRIRVRVHLRHPLDVGGPVRFSLPVLGSRPPDVPIESGCSSHRTRCSAAASRPTAASRGGARAAAGFFFLLRGVLLPEAEARWALPSIVA